MSRVHRVDKFINFAGELQRRAPSAVLIEASLSNGNGTTNGRTGHFVQGLFYSVTTPNRSLHYTEDLPAEFQAEHNAGGAQNREYLVGSLLLAAEVRVQQLRQVLPGADVQVGDGHGVPVSDEYMGQIREELDARGVVSALPDQIAAWLS